MSKEKPTPTPWEVVSIPRPDDSPLVVIETPPMPYGEMARIRIRIAELNRHYETTEANAELIVRAVNCHYDFVKACRDALEYVQTSLRHTRDITGMSREEREKLTVNHVTAKALIAVLAKAGAS